MRRLTASLLLIVFFIPMAYAQSDSDRIREMLDSRDDEIKELLGSEGNEYTQDQREQLKDIVNDVIYYRAMAEAALGNTFGEISEEEQSEFVSLFSTIIRDNSLNSLDIYRARVVYDNIEVNGETAMVETTAELEGVRTTVAYDMIKMGGEWWIVDMIIDDVSTTDSYNRQFESIIRQRGFDALIDSLRRRAARA